MSTKAIPDFTELELKLASQTLFERYGRLVPLQTADADIQLMPDDESSLATCPALYWEERGAHFIVFKLAANRYRAQFYYNEAAQYGTGKDSFDNLGDCMITLLQVQADHEKEMQSIRAGMTRLEITGDDYDGPLII